MQKQNIKLALSIVLLLMSMLILSFASVPIYSLFCKATGFGGTVTRQESFLKPQKGIRKIIVEFDANVDKDLPWRFVPKHRRAEVTTGETALIFYESKPAMASRI